MIDRASLADAIARVETQVITVMDARRKELDADAAAIEAQEAYRVAQKAYREAEEAARSAERDLQSAKDNLMAIAIVRDIPADPFMMDDGPMYVGIFGR